MTVTTELFYSPLCSYCPEAMESLFHAFELNWKIRLDEVNVSSPEGLERTEKQKVMSVLSIATNMRRKIVDVPGKEEIIKLISQEK